MTMCYSNMFTQEQSYCDSKVSVISLCVTLAYLATPYLVKSIVMNLIAAECFKSH